MEWEAPLVSCETRATTFVVVCFATRLPIPITDASDPATRMKRHSKATMMKGDAMPKNGGNDDDEEREKDTEKSEKDTEKREKENEEEGETTKKSRGQTEEGRDTKKSRGQTEEGRDDKEGG